MWIKTTLVQSSRLQSKRTRYSSLNAILNSRIMKDVKSSAQQLQSKSYPYQHARLGTRHRMSDSQRNRRGAIRPALRSQLRTHELLTSRSCHMGCTAGNSPILQRITKMCTIFTMVATPHCRFQNYSLAHFRGGGECIMPSGRIWVDT